MQKKTFSIEINRNDFNFSAAQIIVANGEMEPLSGHNYQLGLVVEAPVDSDGLLIDFRTVKKLLREIVGTFNHKTLVPLHCPGLAVTTTEGRVVIEGYGVMMTIPASHCLMLETTNTSCECISDVILEELRTKLLPLLPNLARLSVTVMESAGQSATATVVFA